MIFNHADLEKLRLAVEGARLGVFDWCAATGALVWSDEAKRQAGLPLSSENTFEEFLRAVHPDDREAVENAVCAALAPGSTGRYEMQYRTAGLSDGIERVLEARGQAYFDAAGDPVRFVGTTLDITDRRQAEESRRETEERFRTLADNIAQLAWMADGDGRVFWCNCRWYEYTGLLSDSPLYDPLDRLHPAETERVTAHLRQSLESGEPWEDVFRLRGADQRYRWFLARATPIRNPAGEIFRWFCTSTDITAQKRTEAALRRSNEDLQEFAYIASHDLREPLRNISTYADLLTRTYGDERLRGQRDRCVEVITGAARRMEAMIAGILSYSRASGETRIAPEPVDLNAVFDESLANLATALRESGATVTRGHLPAVPVDRRQLTQVFQHLVGNSLEYRRPGIPPVVHLSVECRHDEWLFCVRDNGEGFRPEYASRIFGIFKRLHGIDRPGAGIGLAICRSIIESHHGNIWAVGRLGEGADFYFTLPRS